MRKHLYLLLAVPLVFSLSFCSEALDPQTDSEVTSLARIAGSNGVVKQPLPVRPFWSRLEGGGLLPDGVPQTDEWGIIYFYVTNPEVQVPRDFNLLLARDPRALSAEFAVEGFRFLPGGTPPPSLIELKGLGAVPFWVITSSQVAQVVADNVVTTDELLALDPPPLKGFAHSFTEHQRPVPGGSPVNGTRTTAEGVMEDGRRFNFFLHTRVAQQDVQTQFNMQ